MPYNEHQIVGWVNLPGDAVETSLWTTLHDGKLIAVESDLFARTLTLRFKVDYVNEFHKLPEDTRFVIVISSVKSVRSFCWAPWPGEFSIPAGTPYEEQRSMVDEYQSKGREESLRWADFERMVQDDLEVSHAVLAQRDDGVALRMELLICGDSYVEAIVRGEKIRFSIEHRELTPEEFVGLGDAYWEAFARRRKVLD